MQMISKYIKQLTIIWIKWMENHNKSNNSNLAFTERRKSGEKCEKLQTIRRKLIIKIDDLIEGNVNVIK